jgi:hypothetical protein
MRTSLNHQPEVHHPKSPAIRWAADYPIYALKPDVNATRWRNDLREAGCPPRRGDLFGGGLCGVDLGRPCAHSPDGWGGQVPVLDQGRRHRADTWAQFLDQQLRVEA